MVIKDSAKTVLCFGDSNTWGDRPDGKGRYPRSIRWPAVLQALLGEGYEVVSEGLCGRTLIASDPGKPHRVGITHLRALLETHDPVSLVIIMLGTNDTQIAFGQGAEEIAAHLRQTVELIRDQDIDLDSQPAILVVCPPPPVKPENAEPDPGMARAPEIFKELPQLYKRVAEESGCAFLDAGRHVSSSKVDGYHLDEDAHLKLAHVMNERVRELI